MSTVAMIVGGFGFAGGRDFDPRERDQAIDIIFLTVIGVALAGISLHKLSPAAIYPSSP